MCVCVLHAQKQDCDVFFNNSLLLNCAFRMASVNPLMQEQASHQRKR